MSFYSKFSHSVPENIWNFSLPGIFEYSLGQTAADHYVRGYIYLQKFPIMPCGATSTSVCYYIVSKLIDLPEETSTTHFSSDREMEIDQNICS